MDTYFKWFYNLIIDAGMSESTALNFNLAINSILIIVLLFVFDYIIKKIIVKVFKSFTNRTKTTFDDFLVKSNFPKYVAHIIPFFLLRSIIPSLFFDFNSLKNFFLKATDVYLIFLIIWIFRSLINSTINYLRHKDYFKDKPLDSYAQILIIFIWFIGLLFMFSEITGQSIITFLATLGAASAVLLLIFKDSILGFVASIQVSVNDMVRIGDWISVEKYGADGDVTEINLTTVKVSNWDKTTTTIPTYALISDSFKNWRGMQDSGGRRIKRALIIKVTSVKFLKNEDLKKFSKIQVLGSFIKHRQKDIEQYNIDNNIDTALMINGRNQTNLGIFRKYCDLYLNNHPALNKEMSIMTRHLEPNGKGIPIEVYAFSKDKQWVNYEHIMADIFEHLIAAIPYFELELYQEPSSRDIQALKAN